MGSYGPTAWVSTPKAGKSGKRKRAEVDFDPFVVTPALKRKKTSEAFSIYPTDEIRFTLRAGIDDKAVENAPHMV